MIKGDIDWEHAKNLVDYDHAIKVMEADIARIYSKERREKIWFLEHPSLITAGTSAKIEDLIEPNRFPVYKAGRGGEYTYHGPGQEVTYLMLDLKKRIADLKAYVAFLENWLIEVLAHYDVKGERRAGRVGIWVAPTATNKLTKESKIAAIGIRVRRWVSYHGIALNNTVNLEHFSAIIPCGIGREYGVTSLKALGVDVLQTALRKQMAMVLEKKLCSSGSFR